VFVRREGVGERGKESVREFGFGIKFIHTFIEVKTVRYWFD